jgi:hypothetical protein
VRNPPTHASRRARRSRASSVPRGGTSLQRHSKNPGPCGPAPAHIAEGRRGGLIRDPRRSWKRTAGRDRTRPPSYTGSLRRRSDSVGRCRRRSPTDTRGPDRTHPRACTRTLPIPPDTDPRCRRSRRRSWPVWTWRPRPSRRHPRSTRRWCRTPRHHRETTRSRPPRASRRSCPRARAARPRSRPRARARTGTCAPRPTN